MLKHRLLTGSLLIALLVGVTWLDGRVGGEFVSTEAWQRVLGASATPPRGAVIVAFALVVVAPLLGLEIGRLLRACGSAVPPSIVAVGVSLLAAAVLVAGTAGAGVAPALLPIAAAVAVGLAALLASARPGAFLPAVQSVGGTVLAAVYAGGCLGGWLLLRQGHSAWILGGAVLLVKSSDIGAYFTGITLGRRKLIPWLSPGKTWEGTAGGVLLAMLVGWIWASWSTAEPNPADRVAPALGVALGAVLAVAGQAGDLSESLLKRAAGAKDSGNTLPGLGGVFDVMDSLLPAGVILPLVLLAAGAAAR